MRKHLLVLLLLAAYFHAPGQGLRTIVKSIEKHSFEKAHKKLNKLLLKDSLNVGAYYLYSLYYLDSANRLYQVDSSYKYILSAQALYPTLQKKQQRALEKLQIDSLSIKEQKTKIDSIKFAVTTKIHTEASYIDFINRHPTSQQIPEAIRQRNLLAYSTAEQQNTYHSYLSFIEKYPQAQQIRQAAEKYHILLYQDKTQRGTIESFENFVLEYPNNPHRDKAEEELYELFITDNKISTHKAFIQRFPWHKYFNRVWKCLWYLTENKEKFLEKYPDFPDKNFVATHLEKDTLLYFPFILAGKYGFMDYHGKEVIDVQFANIAEYYKCEGIQEDIIKVFNEKGEAAAVDKTGKLLTTYEYNTVENFGAGALLVSKGRKYGLLHKENFTLLPTEYESLKFVNQSVIKAKKDGAWGLLTYNNKILVEPIYDNITAISATTLALKRNNRYGFVKTDDLLKSLPTKSLEPTLPYDRYEYTHENFLLLEDKAKKSIVNLEGKKIIDHFENMLEVPEGWIIERQKQSFVYNLEGQNLTPSGYENIISSTHGYAVQEKGLWGFIDILGKISIPPAYDTTYFLGDSGILLKKKNKKYGYFYQDTTLRNLSAYEELNIKVINNQQAVSDSRCSIYIIVRNKYAEGVITSDGKQIIRTNYDQIKFLNDQIIRLTYKGKTGLANTKGQIILRLRYKGISAIKKGYFSLFKDKKFGIFDPKTNTVIPTIYESIPELYGQSDSIFIAKKEKFGLINQRNEMISPFQFEQIKYWSDTIMLVNHSNKWKLYNFAANYFVAEVFDTFEYIRKDEKEIVIVTYRSSGYGLLSNKQGRLIPEEYSAILDISQSDVPLYFVEKYNAMAKSYLILYIDQKGKVSKSQYMYEKDYEKIICKE